ncbi:BlaI/MecI/CopY family transcriptional regulator [Spirillospora sp. CA-255316]
MGLPRSRDLEAAVMDLMWSYDRAVQVGDVLRDLQWDRTIAPAVMTKLMDRLRRKGWLKYESAGEARLFQPAASRGEYADRLILEVLAAGGDSPPIFLQIPSIRPPWTSMRCALR